LIIPFSKTSATIILTDKSYGNMSPFTGASNDLFQLILPKPWVFVKQIHSSKVINVNKDKLNSTLTVIGQADALVTTEKDIVLAVLGADCPCVLFSSKEGPIGASHAGWRGLKDGILLNTVTMLRQLGANEIYAARGPCACVNCYEFGQEILEFEKIYGSKIKQVDKNGKAYLNLRKVIELELENLGVELVWQATECTICSNKYFSFRRDKTTKRHVAAIAI
jgi:YfiH family protein